MQVGHDNFDVTFQFLARKFLPNFRAINTGGILNLKAREPM